MKNKKRMLPITKGNDEKENKGKFIQKMNKKKVQIFMSPKLMFME